MSRLYEKESPSKADKKVQSYSYTSANDYAEAVRGWLMQYHSWYQSQVFNTTMSYYMMGYMATVPNMSLQNRGTSTFVSPAGSVQQPRQQFRNNNQGQTPVPNVNRAQREFRIAPVWKRVVAELFDFLLLFIMKLAVTVVAVEHIGIIDLDKYDIELDKLFNHSIDYNLALNLTTELVALEVINRVCITLFETLCLRRGVAGMVGGATPGKRFMGIKVVSCEDLVVDLGNGLVRITPAANIGFWNALVRSVIKNFSLAFFFPVCFTALFFQHHRAAYDVISNCIVVEPVQRRR